MNKKTLLVLAAASLLVVLMPVCLSAGNVGGSLQSAFSKGPQVINLYEGFSCPDDTMCQEITITPLFPFALGDILLCQPGFQCPSMVEGTIDGTNPMWSDVVRFADLGPNNGGYVAIFYSDPLNPNFIFGPNDINLMIAAGFAQPGDVMGGNSGQVLLETTPTPYGNYLFWSEIPEPGTLSLLGAGVLAAAGAIRRRLSM